MGSTRLPGKVLLKINEKSVLEHVVFRLQRVKSINEIVIATTLSPLDDLIVLESDRLKVKWFRGDEIDVLSRYYYAAKESNAEIIVRITSDCPLIDSEITDDIVSFYIEKAREYDYVSNTIVRTYPRGLDTEVFTFKSLEKAFLESEESRDREHVTPYIWDNSEIFRVAQYTNSVDFSKLRWTLDTQEDLVLIKQIYENFPVNSYFSMKQILALLKEKPYLQEINRNIEQKKLI